MTKRIVNRVRLCQECLERLHKDGMESDLVETDKVTDLMIFTPEPIIFSLKDDDLSQYGHDRDY